MSVNSFILSNFNYCPLIWGFTSQFHRKKIEKVNERALRLIDNDYFSSYELLLKKYDKTTIDLRNLQNLATEIFKTLNNLNPNYMRNIFEHKAGRSSERLKFNIKSQKCKSVKFGKKSIRVLGPILWNSLSNK